MTAAGQQLGEEGERAALCVASSGRSMELPGVEREHQAGLDELARGFAQARGGMALSWDWRRRIKREAQEAEKWQARQGERQERGLPPEPEQDRERQWQSCGLGLGR